MKQFNGYYILFDPLRFVNISPVNFNQCLCRRSKYKTADLLKLRKILILRVVKFGEKQKQGPPKGLTLIDSMVHMK